jgi:hypothetical protein
MEPRRQLRFAVTDDCEVLSETCPDDDSPIAGVFGAFISRSRRFSVIFMRDKNTRESSVSMRGPHGRVMVDVAISEDADVLQWYDSPVTDGGYLMAQLNMGEIETVNLAVFDINRETRSDIRGSVEFNLLSSMLLGNFVPLHANLSGVKMGRICGIGSPDGVQTFAVQIHHFPTRGQDSTALVWVNPRSSAEYITATCLPHPFARSLDSSDPQDGTRVALTPTRCIVIGTVLDASENGVSSTTHTELRCYDSRSGALVWTRRSGLDRDPVEWRYKHVVTHGSCFYVSAITASCAAADVSWDDPDTESLLVIDEDGNLLRVIQGVIQPDTLFVLSPSGSVCANLHKDGTFRAFHFDV